MSHYVYFPDLDLGDKIKCENNCKTYELINYDVHINFFLFRSPVSVLISLLINSSIASY